MSLRSLPALRLSYSLLDQPKIIIGVRQATRQFSKSWDNNTDLFATQDTDGPSLPFYIKHLLPFKLIKCHFIPLCFLLWETCHRSCTKVILLLWIKEYNTNSCSLFLPFQWVFELLIFCCQLKAHLHKPSCSWTHVGCTPCFLGGQAPVVKLWETMLICLFTFCEENPDHLPFLVKRKKEGDYLTENI